MSKKPRPTRPAGQRRVQNEMHIAAGGALLATNALLAAAAVDLELADAAEGKALAGRYTRVRKALMKTQGCSKAAAERAIAEGKVIFLDRWRTDLPERRERLSLQLQAIADAHQHHHPHASIAALREIGRLNGLYAPTKLQVTHNDEVTVDLRLDAVIDILDDAGLQALEVLQQQIERAKTEGRLALPAPAAAKVDDAVDAEFTEGN